MLCKATEADLEQMVAFRRKTYGGTRQDALDWLCGIVGLDNILILARDPAPGAKPIPAAMIGAVPVNAGTTTAYGSAAWQRTRPCRGAG
ncbi:MAG: hypothetical protein ACLTGG_04835 [Subdoligranulum sp.]